MTFCFTVTPAYGRDYKNRAEALAAWVKGDDFINATQHITGGGTYMSERDCDHAKIRHDQLQKAFVVRRVNGKWKVQ